MAQKIAISLNVFGPEPLSKQLFTSLLRSIEEGKIRAGEKLPSIRDMAKQLQISTITVREAIDGLIEKGVVVSRHGSGNYVSGSVAAVQPAGEPLEELQFTQSTYASADWNLDESFRWTAQARHMNEAFNQSSFHPWWDVPVAFDFRVYQPPTESIEGLHWSKIVERYARGGLSKHSEIFDFQGTLELRRELSQWLNRTRKLNTSVHDLFIVSGAQQARDLVAAMLVKEGTKVVVEEPGSITDLLAYKSKGAELISVAQDNDGIIVDLLNCVKGASVAHLLTTANFPTGATLSRQRAQKVLSWAKLHGVTIVEDAYGGGFIYDDAQTESLAQLASGSDQAGGSDDAPDVIYIGSLSQLLNPALRVAFVIVPERFHGAFSRSHRLAQTAPSVLSQRLVLNYFGQGYFDEDVARVTQAARLRRKALLSALETWSPNLISFFPVKAGFHQSVWFNEEIDDLRVFEVGLSKGIGIVPLSAYFRSDNGKSGMSLSFAQMNETKIQAGLEQLLPIVEGCR